MRAPVHEPSSTTWAKRRSWPQVRAVSPCRRGLGKAVSRCAQASPARGNSRLHFVFLPRLRKAHEPGAALTGLKLIVSLLPDIRSVLRPLVASLAPATSRLRFLSLEEIPPPRWRRDGGDRQGPPIASWHQRAGGTGHPSVRECGLPEGVFSLLFDRGMQIGIALAKHPRKAVAFTGSHGGGRALMDLAAAP